MAICENERNHGFRHFVNKQKSMVKNGTYEENDEIRSTLLASTETNIMKQQHQHKLKNCSHSSPTCCLCRWCLFNRCFFRCVFRILFLYAVMNWQVMELKRFVCIMLYMFVLLVRVARTVAGKRNALGIRCLQFINTAPREFY